MATVNPFDLLADDDNDDPSHLIAVQGQKVAAKKPPAPAAAATRTARLPSKTPPPAQAVKEARSNGAPPSHGSAIRGGTWRGRGGRGGGAGPNRDFGNGDVNGFAGGYGGGGGGGGFVDKPSERGRGGYGSQRPFPGGRRGGYGNGNGGSDSERPPQRMYERRSGTGRSYEMKREGAGRGNWGTTEDDLIAQVTEGVAKRDELANSEKQAGEKDGPQKEVNKEDKEAPANETEEKETEDKEMTLEEYEKVRDEKRKALLAMKSEERKVELDKDFESMQQLSIKKGNDDVLIKLGSEKVVGRKKDNADREEHIKKSVSITEFLKPAEGERYYGPGSRGRGRGRGRGDRGSFGSDFGGKAAVSSVPAPSIEDPGQFPTLGRK